MSAFTWSRTVATGKAACGDCDWKRSYNTLRSPQARGDENLVWHAWRLDAPSGGSLSTRAYLLLLDPDQFGEVVE